jgi:hypothetical protein
MGEGSLRLRRGRGPMMLRPNSDVVQSQSMTRENPLRSLSLKSPGRRTPGEPASIRHHHACDDNCMGPWGASQGLHSPIGGGCGPALCRSRERQKWPGPARAQANGPLGRESGPSVDTGLGGAVNGFSSYYWPCWPGASAAATNLCPD